MTPIVIVLTQMCAPALMKRKRSRQGAICAKVPGVDAACQVLKVSVREYKPR